MAWYHRLLNVFRRDRLARDLDTEISFHLAERIDDLVTRGMTPDAAAREARRRFGNLTVQKERTHDADSAAWLESLAADARYALRALRRSPGFTAVAVLSLGLGIGANTAIFSLSNALMHKTLPVAQPDELVQVTRGDDDASASIFTNPLWEQLRDHASGFDGLFAYGDATFNLARGGEVRRVEGAWVSGDFFRTLGIRAVTGRLLQRSDDVRGCPAVAVVGEGFAARELGGARAAVGRELSLDGHPFEVIGTTPSSFFGVTVGTNAEVFTPLCAQVLFQGPNALANRTRWWLHVIGRAAQGIALPQLRAGLATLSPAANAATLPPNRSAERREEYLRTSLGAAPAATGLSTMRGRYGSALFLLLMVVGAVLLVACANIANLMLARGATRRQEFALRMALGAGPRRILRQMLTESGVLSLAGAVVGILFARWASRLLVGLLAKGSSTVWLNLDLDLRVLAFTALVATVTGLLFGSVPAWRATRVAPQATMQSGSRGTVDGDSRHRVGRGLVVGQVALSLALVAISALLLGTFRTLMTLDPGFRRDGLLITKVNFANAGLDSAARAGTERDLLDRLRAIPGVTATSASLFTPVGGSFWNDRVAADGAHPAGTTGDLAWFNNVTPGFFATMGTPLLAGRDFTAGDNATSTQVAIVNQSMARRFFGDGDVLGRTFRVPVGDEPGTPVEIVGVVGDAKYGSLSEKSSPTVYRPHGQGEAFGTLLNFEMRYQGSTASVIAGAKATIATVNPALSLQFTTMQDQLAASLVRQRLLATLSAFFGTLALLLAVIGLYGTMSYTVMRRRTELGIRVALGAGRAQLVRMVIGEAGRLIALGLTLGLVLSFATTRLVRSFLFGVTPTDPLTLVLAVALLGTVATVAAAIPAVRAARLDPMESLRQE